MVRLRAPENQLIFALLITVRCYDLLTTALRLADRSPSFIFVVNYLTTIILSISVLVRHELVREKREREFICHKK